MLSFHLVVRSTAGLHPGGGPADFISEHHASIRCHDDDGVVRRVGTAHAFRLHAERAARQGEALGGICDAHSHQLHILHMLLYEPGQYHFREGLLDRFAAFDPDCLILDYVVLDPKWRGLKLGLLAARGLVDVAGGGCGLVVARFAPLGPDGRDPPRVPPAWLPPPGTPDAVAKLRRHFRRMGFGRIGKTPYFGLSVAGQTPTLEEMLKPSA
jgi:hypothetical protein